MSSTERPRTFCWIAGLRGPEPQLLFDDPRVGCERLPVIPGSAVKLDPADGRSLDALMRAYPAPAVEKI